MALLFTSAARADEQAVSIWLVEGERNRVDLLGSVHLLRAGVEGSQAFVAVTSGDNSNIVAARTAKQHFGIPTVVARIVTLLDARLVCAPG